MKLFRVKVLDTFNTNFAVINLQLSVGNCNFPPPQLFKPMTLLDMRTNVNGVSDEQWVGQLVAVVPRVQSSVSWVVR